MDAIFYDDLCNKIRYLRHDIEVLRKAEFIVVVLRLMDKINDADVFFVSEVFDGLDTQRSGQREEYIDIYACMRVYNIILLCIPLHYMILYLFCIHIHM